MLTALFACASGGDSVVDKVLDSADTATTAQTDSDSATTTTEAGDTTTVPGTLVGTYPEVALSVPTFTVTNRDGSMRSEADLIGHPTILWFYPAATTSG